MKLTRNTVLKTLGVIAALGFAMAVGYQVASTAGTYPASSGTNSNTMGIAQKDASYAGAGAAVAPDAVGSVGAPTIAPTSEFPTTPESSGSQRMVVSTASMSLRVDHIDEALSSVRRIATVSKSEITNLVVTRGDTPQPVPLTTDSGAVVVAGPANAQVTLRVPAEQLSAVEQRVAELGTVLSQSASEDDVTQQHVDMEARLKNLQAEEARLRTFLLRTGKVSELLVVERELSRVRGEIESMQAQLTYLERQAAMATLTIALSEPGPVVSPGSGGWGLGQAVTDGVRAAASLIRATITLAIPLALIAAVGGLIALAWRAIRRRRAARRDPSAEE